MFSKLIKVLLLLVMILGISTYTADATNAASVMWGKTELKLGQIGKVTILADTVLVELEDDGSLTTVRAIKKGEEYRVYSFKNHPDGTLYGVGGGSFVQAGDKVKYETPSKSKMELLKYMIDNPTPVQAPVVTTKTKAPVAKAPAVQTGFKNCTELRKVYPGGVSSSHPAYKSKFDRDKDGWGCE
ncbi:excalibur calcium-binding domain-containing protein [Psychrobacillus lasiicapitis]|uniref:Excalibur calcium-binding domain-containing protein n=1 Tax=Psychrobacillus lasiicapitis TaxID=1636719 RepID=A0A544T8T3_9BACI|nr:hypothetical protein FG382_09600 [Psychrobacillus lasiicapitis]GGA35984.1 hypothetical protein GCM10011384_27130 [Psychrobacillus lasiicapitis]